MYLFWGSDSNIPGGIWRKNDAVLTSMRRHQRRVDVNTKSFLHHMPLGCTCLPPFLMESKLFMERMFLSDEVLPCHPESKREATKCVSVRKNNRNHRDVPMQLLFILYNLCYKSQILAWNISWNTEQGLHWEWYKIVTRFFRQYEEII